MGDPLRAPAAADPLALIGDRLAPLERAMGHRFGDRALLVEALTHPSVLGRGHAKQRGRRSYERLEFLGDRVLGLIVADLLMRRFPHEAEGALTKRLGTLVNRDALAEVARGLELGRWIDVASSEEAGRDKPGLLADACEAVIAAVYLDGGLDSARAVVEARWCQRIEGAATPPGDAKMELQEWAQARAMELPAYRVVEATGPAHALHFTIEASLAGAPPSTGLGASKRAAERAAAAALLQTLKGAGHG